MSNLPGNPHYREADNSEVGTGPFVQAQAVLTLAYEQRTANLIAFFESQWMAHQSDCLDTEGIMQMNKAGEQIAGRLGLA